MRSNAFKLILPILLLLLTAFSAFGQATNFTNFAAGGASFSPGATPAVAGTGLYARLFSSTADTYSYSVIDALPASVKPFTVTTQLATGVAQKITTIGTVGIYIPAAAGVAWNGQNTGWSWSSGALASIPVKKYHLMPNVRMVKSSVNGNSGYQVILGVLFGAGWN